MRRAFQLIRQRQEELLLLIALSFGLAIVIGPIFHLSFWQSLMVAVPIGVALIVTFSSWLASRRRKQNRPLRTESHPEFGDVRLFADRWEAVVSGAPFPQRIEVAGDSRTPSARQLGLFRSIRERYDALVSAAMDSLSAELKAFNPPVSPSELVLSSIWLSSRGDTFSFTFDVPTRNAKMPDGLYADFAGFKIQEAGWVH
jgi:hypothetical protein